MIWILKKMKKFIEKLLNKFEDNNNISTDYHGSDDTRLTALAAELEKLKWEIKMNNNITPEGNWKGNDYY